MIQIANSSLSILLVDDSEYKIEKVQQFLNNVLPNSKVIVAKDSISAQKCLELEKFDLLLLDMQLPNRYGESEPEEEGGLVLLKELEIGDNFKQPTRIIVFTQYDELQVNIRADFPELGAVKFDPTSDDWERTLYRSLLSLSKSKKVRNKIVYCEGDNVSLYNSVGLPGIEFWSLRDSRSIYFAAKNEKDKFALRDRDFLTSNEIRTLTQKPYFENYFILDYYCFENYIYHPSNICEVVSDFNQEEYINELKKQKNEKLESIIQDYKLARLGYTDFIDNDKNNMDENPENEIIVSLKSDDFETFYKFFDMAGKKDKHFKKSFNKKYLEKYNLDAKKLAKTNWFNHKIREVLAKIL